MVFFSRVKDPGYVKKVSLINDVPVNGDPMDDSSPPDINLKTPNQVNAEQVPWLPRIWHETTTAGSKALEACDYLGESLAWFFGITSPKFQYEINEYAEMKNTGSDHDTASNSSTLPTENKILQFSDGLLELDPTGNVLPVDLYSETVNQENEKDPEPLTWLQWICYGTTLAETKAFKAVENIGELLAWFLGISSPMYPHHDVNEYLRMKKEGPDYANNTFLIDDSLTKKHPMDNVSSPDMDLKKENEKNPEQLTWLQWIWCGTTTAGSKTLEVCDDLGEWLAAFFGITTPKYQYEINEYLELREKEANEKVEFGFLPYKYNPRGYYRRPRFVPGPIQYSG